MTRIGNDTKTPASKSTAAGDGARDAKQATQTEDAPTLDELDAGMSLERSYANPELQSADVYGADAQRRATTSADDGGMSSFEGMTPIDETPLARDISDIEQQCALEMQGHAYELRALGGETAGDDGICLERAADALMTSSEAAAEARPGSALPVLEQGVTNARGHVQAVVDDDVRGKGAGLLDKAWSGLTSAKAAVGGAFGALRPEPAPGETHEIGIAGSVEVGLAGGESRDVLSIARERQTSGEGGDYVVARELTLVGSAGFKPKAGGQLELGSTKLSAKGEVEVAAKLGASVRVEYRSASLEKARERYDDIVGGKMLGVAGALAGPAGALLGSVVDIGNVDLNSASSVTLSGTGAAEAASELGIRKAQASGKGSFVMKLELDDGRPHKAEATESLEVEGGLSAAFGGTLAKLDLKTSDISAASVTAAVTRKTRFNVDEKGELESTGVDVGATFKIQVAGQELKGEITLPAGEDRDAVVALLEEGEPSLAFDRLLASGGHLKLEGVERMGLAIGGSVALGAKVGIRGHYAKQSSHVLAEKEGPIGAVLKEALSKSLSPLQDTSHLQRQVNAHQQFR